jgi:uncharacterized protein YajQ (UPF0234 family)
MPTQIASFLAMTVPDFNIQDPGRLQSFHFNIQNSLFSVQYSIPTFGKITHHAIIRHRQRSRYPDLDNAINTVKKEISTRFDFRGSPVTVELNKKDYSILLEVESDMKMKQLIDVLISRAMKQGIDAGAFDFSKDAYPSGKVVKKDIPVRNGLKQDDAKKIVKMIKEAGFKVQVAIMDDIIRVTGKKLDDLQEVIAKCRTDNFGIPLQFVNMKS